MGLIFKEEEQGNQEKYNLDFSRISSEVIKQKQELEILERLKKKYNLVSAEGTTYQIRKRGIRNKANPRQEEITDRKIVGRFNLSLRTAKSKLVDWELTYEEYEKMIKKNRCTYCLGPLDANGIGLDRKDSSKGYTKKNSTPCCYDCNKVKSDVLDFEEMKVAMQAVLEYRKSKGEK